MVNIHGIAYLVIGTAVILFSWYTNSTTEQQTMTVFFYVGALFILIGLIKISIQIMKKKKKTEATLRRHSRQDHHAMHHTEHRLQPSRQANHPVQHLSQTHQQHIPNQSHTVQTPRGQHQAQRQTTPSPSTGSRNSHHDQHHLFPQVQHCPSCGARNQQDARFCMRCGGRLG